MTRIANTCLTRLVLVLVILVCDSPIFSHTSILEAVNDELKTFSEQEASTTTRSQTSFLQQQQQDTHVLYDLYTDPYCSTSKVSILIRNTTCTPNMYCDSNVQLGYFGRVVCPGNNPPPPRPGQVQAMQYNDGASCQDPRPIVTYFPKNVCSPDLFVTAMDGYSGKANCSQYTSFHGDTCSQGIYKQYTFVVNNDTCNSNEFNTGYSLTCHNDQSDPYLNGYISYDLFSDSACTVRLSSTLVRPSQVCIPSGFCVQLAWNVFGIANCMSNLPSLQPGQMAIRHHYGYTCELQYLKFVEYHPLDTCSFSMNFGYVKASCSSYYSYNDNKCQTGGIFSNYSSTSCYDMQTGFSLGYSSNCVGFELKCWDLDVMGSPIPVIESTVIAYNTLVFKVNITKDDHVNLEYYMFFGTSEFNFTTCRVVGDERMNVSSNISYLPCTESFVTSPYLVDHFISSNATTKTYSGDHMTLSIPISIHVVDTRVTTNGGFCRDYKFTTTQVINVQLSPAISISTFNQTTPLNGYLTNLYPIEFSTNSGFLVIQIIFEATNVSLMSLEFYNSTNSLFALRVTETQFLYQNFATFKKYYRVVVISDQTANDYRSLVYFKTIWKRKGVLDTVIEYLPLQITYTIITPPSQKNFTLESTMSLSNNDWTPKIKFLSDERLFAQVHVTTPLGDRTRIRVKDAFMCCFKEFTASITYNPSSGQYGCSRFNSLTMDVWKPVIANSVPDSQVETLTYQFGGNNFYGFSFKLLSTLFPEKYSQQSTSCFLQAHVEPITTNSLSRSMNEAESATVVTSSLFVVDVKKLLKAASISSAREGKIGYTCMGVTPYQCWIHRNTIFAPLYAGFDGHPADFCKYAYDKNPTVYKQCAAQLYEQNYFNQGGCSPLPMPAYYVCADIAVNSGVGRSQQYISELGGYHGQDAKEFARALNEKHRADYIRWGCPTCENSLP
nr:unnamed protein product [Naegleria fowleri]